MDSVTEQMPEFYARMGFSRTAKNGWSGEFTVSIRGPVWDMKQMEAFTAEARQRMLDEIDLLNKITGTKGLIEETWNADGTVLSIGVPHPERPPVKWTGDMTAEDHKAEREYFHLSQLSQYWSGAVVREEVRS